jgi:hypothetical protein
MTHSIQPARVDTVKKCKIYLLFSQMTWLPVEVVGGWDMADREGGREGRGGRGSRSRDSEKRAVVGKGWRAAFNH